MRRILFVVLAAIAALGVAALASAAGKPPSSPNNPVIRFVSPSPTEDAALPNGDVSLAFTFNRTPKQVATVTCALSGQATSSGPCNAPVSFPSNSKTDSKSGKFYTGLANGAYTFTVTLTLTGGGVYTASRLFTVAVNRAPVANSQSVSTDEDTATAITLTGSDPDGDPLTYGVASSPAHGTLSGTAPNLTYTPAADYFGTDSFTFTARDGTASSNAATVSITVDPVNDPPVAGADAAATANHLLTINTVALLANDVAGPPSESAQVLTVVSVTAGPDTHGTVSLAANTVTYTPDAGFVGTASFTYTVVDDDPADPLTGTGTVTITVAPAPNESPVADSQSVSTDEDTATAITLTGSDPDGDPLTYGVASSPAHGTLSGTAPNLTYTPDAGYAGPDSFTFTVSDAQATSIAATVSIAVGTADVEVTGRFLTGPDTHEVTVTNRGPGTTLVTVDAICSLGFLTVQPAVGWTQIFFGHYSQTLASGESGSPIVLACTNVVGSTVGAGAGSFQVVASSLPDPDSTPNNGIATEDDYYALVP